MKLKPWLVIVALASAFVAWTSQALPARVASHFDIAGHPDAALSHGSYVGLMLALVVGMPLAMWAAEALRASRRRRRGLTAPAAERQIGIAGNAAFAIAVVCFAHALVLAANRSAPVRLSLPLLAAGLAVLGTIAFARARAADRGANLRRRR